MNNELKPILARVDHTLLSQTATWDQIRAICDDGVKYGCASVCIPASYVKQAAEYVAGKIAVCTVIGFPNGYDTTASKCFQATDAVQNGASEIDMVINIGWVKDGLYDRVLDEIRAVKAHCQGKLLKVIIETCKLTDADLETAAVVAVTLEKYIAAKSLDGLAYYYEGEPGSPVRKLVTNFIVGNSLLTSAGFPMCGEFDIKTCLAMLIMDRLEIGGSFAEFHPVDFANDTVLVGHDGPHHLNIADRRPVIRSLKKYHGKPGSGAGVEFNIKTGPITMLSIGVKADGKFKFIIAEGESVAGPIPPTGNTNTHGKFLPDVRTFLSRWVAEGPTHHFALGIGHHAETIRKVADALGIEAVIIPAGR